MYEGALQNIKHNKGEKIMLIADLLCEQLMSIYKSKAREKGNLGKIFMGDIKKQFKFVLILTILLSFYTGNVFAQLISPGKLTKSHSKLEGLVNCEKCHKLGKGVLDTSCLSCHEKLVQRIKNNKGYHAALNKKCIECHTDHKGADYDIMKFDQKSFDHTKTGYELKEKHKTTCNKCHKKEKTYLGLTTACISCHTDVHKKALSEDCLKCHDFSGWKKVTFDHNKYSKYKLVGKHNKVKCEDCHPRYSVEADSSSGEAKKVYNVLKFKPLKYERCSDCHYDIHKGKLIEKTCEKCHTPEGWEKKTFEHNDPRFSDFKLQGKHEKVLCELCHPEEKTIYKQNEKIVEKLARKLKPIKHDLCSDCHYDVHKEQFKDKKCGGCHTVENEWKKNTFKHESEQYKGFKLDGKHKGVDCEKCHVRSELKFTEFSKEKKASIGKFKPLKSEDCSDCHYDVHKEQFKDKKCSGCHTVENEWKKNTFKHESEQYKGFKLDGKHKGVDCEKCHVRSELKFTEFSKEKKASIGKFKPLKTEDCSDCHYDVHKEQFKDKKCSGCHTVENEWKKNTFKHESEQYKGFKLDGKHKGVDCEKCHVRSELKFTEFSKEKKASIGKFKPLKTEDCSDCHYDVHKEQFKDKKCGGCHTVENEWKKNTFKHESEQYKGFKLDGKHKGVDCEKCHVRSELKFTEFSKEKKASIGKFKPLKSEACRDCHKDVHKGLYKQDCEKCHTPAGWEAKKFLHDPVSFEIKGAHRTLSCRDCHKDTETFKGLDSKCISCHKDPHQNQFGPFCADCHKQQVWIPLNFKHTGIGFRLAGGHRAADCSDCHKNRDYRNTPSDCFACHQADYQSAPIHVTSGFSHDCTECHKITASWQQATFVHTSFHFKGAHRVLKNDCSACHNASFSIPPGTTDQDCYVCHAGDFQSAPDHVDFGFDHDCRFCHSGNTWVIE